MELDMKYLLCLFPLVGTGALWGGIVYKRHLRQKVDSYLRTYGVVTGFEAQGSRHGIVYHPVVEYQIAGRRHSIQSEVGYGKPKEKKGSKMEIMYDPSGTSHAYLVKDYYMGPNIMIGIGGAFLLLGSTLVYHLILFP